MRVARRLGFAFCANAFIQGGRMLGFDCRSGHGHLFDMYIYPTIHSTPIHFTRSALKYMSVRGKMHYPYEI